MADEDEKEEGAAKEASPADGGGKKKLFLIIGGVVTLLLLAGVPVAFFALKEKPADENAELATDAAHPGAHDEYAMEGASDEDELEEGEEAMGALFPLETFVVNLAGAHYIRVQLQLEFAEREMPRRFYAKLVPIRDGIIGLLAGRTKEDLASPKGREQLKEDVKELVNAVLRKQEVKQVYFTQFVIQ